mmetsp:Transcript_13552/g.36000  ORF Transcript_13552/g.36000 Transcript_13552/m.36000 type:complete len:230 (+) Transcript_13552:482-1171(+)
MSAFCSFFSFLSLLSFLSFLSFFCFVVSVSWVLAASAHSLPLSSAAQAPDPAAASPIDAAPSAGTGASGGASGGGAWASGAGAPRAGAGGDEASPTRLAFGPGDKTLTTTFFQLCTSSELALRTSSFVWVRIQRWFTSLATPVRLSSSASTDTEANRIKIETKAAITCGPELALVSDAYFLANSLSSAQHAVNLASALALSFALLPSPPPVASEGKGRFVGFSMAEGKD